MINDKMHEIGILKALGTKNSTVFAIFIILSRRAGLPALRFCCH